MEACVHEVDAYTQTDVGGGAAVVVGWYAGAQGSGEEPERKVADGDDQEWGRARGMETGAVMASR